MIFDSPPHIYRLFWRARHKLAEWTYCDFGNEWERDDYLNKISLGIGAYVFDDGEDLPEPERKGTGLVLPEGRRIRK